MSFMAVGTCQCVARFIPLNKCSSDCVNMSNSIRLCLWLWWSNAIFHFRKKIKHIYKKKSKNMWSSGSPSGQKKTETNFYLPFYGPTIGPPNRKHCKITLELGGWSQIYLSECSSVNNLMVACKTVCTTWIIDLSSAIPEDGPVIDLDNCDRFQTLLPMLRLHPSKEYDIWKPSLPCHVDIPWIISI